ncbi:unnamed protein product [Ilex paraguariensis]|uniref:Phorbol-ester/DAG-type domain-containing protein n=1 Tax=Ilex paraguariensis TaxID=185542 RepID=A0ABC8UWB6_9AQUA
MIPLTKNSIEHFTHPGHRLVQLTANTEYVCDGCKTNGSGTRYRCNRCDFDIHEFCGTCPRSLSSFMHPHPLNLLVCKAKATRRNERVCNVCGDHVEGLFYRCKDCEFDVHPLCTQLPQSLCHALHPAHPLTLQSSSSSSGLCAFCQGSCWSWRYGCGACGFYIHLECLLQTFDSPTQRSVPLGQPRPPGPPPQCSIPPFGPSGMPLYGGSGHGMPSGYSTPRPPPYGGYGYGMPSGPPPYGGYAHVMPSGYSLPGPPPQCSIPPFGPSGLPLYGGSGHGMPSGYSTPRPPPYGGYGYGMPSGPPPYGGYAHVMPSGYSLPWPLPYGYGMPSGYSPYYNGNHQTPTVGGTTNGIAGKMYRLVAQLAVGVASSAIFGLMS